MGEEEKHQIIGRLVSDRNGAKENLELIKADLHRYGSFLYTIAERAKTYDFALARSHYETYKGSFKGDLDQFGKRLSEYEALVEQVRAYNAQLKRLGISD
jgi:hypothetical protein